MGSILRVFNPMGVPLAWLKADTTRSYMINNWDNSEIGECGFTLSTSDAKCTAENIEFGTILLVEDENDELPDWIGFIDSAPTRTWMFGEVQVNAVSAEQILWWRQTYPMQLNGTPGSVFRQLIEWINGMVPGGMPLHAGEIWEGDREGNITTDAKMFECVRRLSKFAGGIGGPTCDFSVTHKINAHGILELYCNLYNHRRGVDTGLDLTELNVRGMEEGLVEQGEIWNYIIAYSRASTPGGRIRKDSWDSASIARHGLRVQPIEAVGTDPDGIQYQADNYLAQYKEATREEPVTLLNVSGLYSAIDLGNRYNRYSTVHGFGESGIGFENQARLTSFEVDDAAHEVAGTLEII